MMIYFNRWILLLLSMILAVVVSTSQETKNTVDEDIVIKRGWKDAAGGWGKRGWNNMQGNWGKRGWERLNPVWGKRMATDEPDLEDFWDGVDKRPDDWANLKGAWGKRSAGQGWSNIKGLWGKRSWGNIQNSWGKRAANDDDLATEFN